jgi:hypothetical protein
MVRNVAFALALMLGTAASMEPAAAQVQVQSLDALDLFSTGSADTGLPTDLWKGSSAPLVRDILPSLGTRPLSPAAAALARRLLATAATAPDGAGNDADLAGARVKALLALGDIGHVDDILARTPNLTTSAALSQTAAEAALIDSNDDKACAISDSMTTDRAAAYWVRLRAFCQARAGDMDAAQLTFTIANQQRDVVYARLMGAVMGAGEPGAASLRGGLDYALSRKLNLPLDAALPAASPALKARLTPPAPPPPPIVGDFTAAEAANLAFLRRAKGLAEFTAAAQDAAPGIASQARARAVLQDPVLFARAALAAGDVDAARAIRGAMTGDAIPGAGPTDLALLDALIAAQAGRPDAQTLDRLIERGRLEGPKSAAQPAALILAALVSGSGGGGMGPEARAEFADFAVARGVALPSRLAALDAAAEAGRKGETGLLALSVADVGAAGPAPADRARIVQALRRAGLEADARAFAAEGLLLLQIK